MPSTAATLPESFGQVYANWRAYIKDRFAHPLSFEYWPQCAAVDRMSRDELLDFQRRRLDDLLQHAVRHVPYYRRWAKEKGIEPGDALKLEDFPIVGKAEYRNEMDLFQSDAFAVKEMKTAVTSATTGEPFKFRGHPYKSDYSYCCLWRGMNRFGLRVGDRRVYVWGVAPNLGEPTLYRWKKRARRAVRDWSNNTLFYDSHVLDHKTVAGVMARIRRWNPTYMHGYVSSLYVLARYLVEKGQVFPKGQLKAVVTESERLYRFQREAMEQAFGCPVLEHYGSLEFGMIAQPDTQGILRINEDQCLVETKPDGEAVITSLMSKAFPFIRYTLGDMLELDEKVADGMPYRSIRKIIGRMIDLIPVPRGGYIHGFLLHPVMEQGIQWIRRYQIHQTSIEHFKVKCILSSPMPPEVQQKIAADFRKIIGEGAKVEFEQVESLANTLSGKFRWVVSDVSDVARKMLDEGQ